MWCITHKKKVKLYLFISPWIKGGSTLCKNCKPLAIPVAMFPRICQDNGFVPFYIKMIYTTREYFKIVGIVQYYELDKNVYTSCKYYFNFRFECMQNKNYVL